MRILVLAETPHVPDVAAWLHGQWWGAAGWTMPATRKALRTATGPAAPVTFVAEEDGIPLGTATLDTEDLPSRPDLSPWLASVFVRPEARGRGIATALLRHVEDAARAQGHARLWLFTSDAQRFYAARGWQLEGPEECRGSPVVLMSRALG